MGYAMRSIDHQDPSFFLHRTEFTIRVTQLFLQVLGVLTQTALAVNAHPTKLHVISMTTAPESQSDSLLLRFSALCVG